MKEFGKLLGLPQLLIPRPIDAAVFIAEVKKRILATCWAMPHVQPTAQKRQQRRISGAC